MQWLLINFRANLIMYSSVKTRCHFTCISSKTGLFFLQSELDVLSGTWGEPFRKRKESGPGEGDREEDEGAVEQSAGTWESLGHPCPAGNH